MLIIILLLHSQQRLKLRSGTIGLDGSKGIVNVQAPQGIPRQSDHRVTCGVMGGTLSRLGGSLRSVWRWDPGSNFDDPDAQLQQHQFQTAVIEATDTGNVEMLKYLHDHECFLCWGGIDSISAKPPLLHRATAKGHKQVVEYLLYLGLDVDKTDTSGMTVLHVACKAGRNSCLPPLMAKSRDMDRRDVWGRTPLIKALVYRNIQAAQMLLERGANPNAADMYGMTPLTTAINYDLMDVLGLLVGHGADINLITHHHGRCFGPPLYLAIINQNFPIVQHLLRLGAATQPRMHDYYFYPNKNAGGPAGGPNAQMPWNYIGFGTAPNNNTNNNNVDHYPVNASSLSPSLQYTDAVSLCMYEIVRHGAEHVTNTLSQSSLKFKILLEVLSAHGHPLGPAPDVLIRVLLNNSQINHDFSMLLYKLQICSASASEDILVKMSLWQSQDMQTDDQLRERGGRMRNRERVEEASRMTQLLKQPPRLVSSLQNQARRVVRKALMNSGGHNVVWACGPLQCPPALKSVLLLRDVDKAFEARGLRSLCHKRLGSSKSLS